MLSGSSAVAACECPLPGDYKYGETVYSLREEKGRMLSLCEENILGEYWCALPFGDKGTVIRTSYT